LNVTALRKILKKHDKNFPRYKLSGTYLQGKLQQQEPNESSTTNDLDRNDFGFHDHINQLYHFGSLSSLVYTLQSSFEGTTEDETEGKKKNDVGLVVTLDTDPNPFVSFSSSSVHGPQNCIRLNSHCWRSDNCKNSNKMT
jgi:hypothetical protein